MQRASDKADFSPATRRLQDMAVRPEKSQRRENACGVGAGIDPDAAVINVHMSGRRVPMDDQLFERLVIVQETSSDPHQLAGILLIERNAWFRTRVCEEKVPQREARLLRLENGAMLSRQGRIQGCARDAPNLGAVRGIRRMDAEGS